MFGTKEKNIREYIVEFLLLKPSTAKKLRVLLRDAGVNTSLQAIYKQLAILVDLEVLIKHSSQYYISNEWIEKISGIFKLQEIELPAPGEKFRYKFQSLQKQDIYWKHLMSAISLNNLDPFFQYCDNQFWIYVPTRESSEADYGINKKDKQEKTFFAIGNVTDLGKDFRKSFRNEFYRIEFHRINSAKENVHTTVVGSIVISSTINNKLSKDITDIFNSTEDKAEKIKNLKSVLGKDQVCGLVIENNAKKAEKIRKQISQPFVI
jgi:hypothetical protein